MNSRSAPGMAGGVLGYRERPQRSHGGRYWQTNLASSLRAAWDHRRSGRAGKQVRFSQVDGEQVSHRSQPPRQVTGGVAQHLLHPVVDRASEIPTSPALRQPGRAPDPGIPITRSREIGVTAKAPIFIRSTRITNAYQSWQARLTLLNVPVKDRVQSKAARRPGIRGGPQSSDCQ